MGQDCCCSECCGGKDEVDYTQPREFQKDFKGPIEDRSCTDIICCLLFVGCIALFLLVAAIAFARGDPKRILYPSNSDGDVCGHDIKNRTKLVFFDFLVCARMGPAVLQLGCPTPQVCVHKCPQDYWNWLPTYSMERVNGIGSAKSDRDKMICLEGKNGNAEKYRTIDVQTLVNDKKCAPYTVPSSPLMGRCLPKMLQEIGGKLVEVKLETGNMTGADNKTVSDSELKEGGKLMARFVKLYGFASSIFDDVVASWIWILVGFGIAVILSLVYVLVLRLIARIVVIFSIVAFVLLFAALTAASFYKYVTLKKAGGEEGQAKLTTDISYYGQLTTTWLVVGIVAGSLLLIIIILLIWLRQRISIAIAIISETSRCISHMMTTLIFPAVPMLMQLLVLVLCIVIGLYISSIGDKEMSSPANETAFETMNNSGLTEEQLKLRVSSFLSQSIPCNAERNGTRGKVCRFLRYGGGEFVPYLQLFNVFMFFWLFNFVDALCMCTLAGAFASYYFALRKPQDIPALPLLYSFWRCIRYHLGSLAFGSFILAVVQLIRVILEYLDYKLKGSENPVAKFFLKCLKCCFWCLEKCIKFLNKNAYIMIAIYGRNFCASAKDAFFLILRNIVRVAVVDKITDFVLFIGKLTVVALVGTLAYYFFNGEISSRLEDANFGQPKDLQYYFVPVIIVIVFTYFCATLFFSVYSMGVETIFLCFLEDLERNDGSSEKPYYMNQELMDILGKENEPLLGKETPKEVGTAEEKTELKELND